MNEMHNLVIDRLLQSWSVCKSTLLFLKEISFTVYIFLGTMPLSLRSTRGGKEENVTNRNSGKEQNMNHLHWMRILQL